MEIKSHIFREYDIRGIVDKDISNDFAYLLGRAFGQLAQERGFQRLAIGYDCRLSSEGYAEALGRGMADEGHQVVITGMGPTPQLYFAVVHGKFGGGIQVTGSHNPPDMNGFKIVLGQGALASEEIQDLRQRMLALQSKLDERKTGGKIEHSAIRETYIADLIQNCKAKMGKRKLKVVVDGGNGVGGLVGPAVLRGLGVEVIELFCEPDGRFPNHHPDPTVLENLHDLIAKVKEHKADFGIGWDGDADRIGVVDEKGNVIFGDMLLLIYARAIIKEKPGATIIGDVKCSSLLFEDLRKRGANAIMWKTGHSLIKKKLLETKGDLGGEMSGHIMFRHRFYGFDDALYCSARLVELMSHFGGAISEILADLPKMVSTPEIRIDCPEEVKFKIAQHAQNSFQGLKVETIDGVRVQFPNGWGLVRASNTQPVLVMRFEASTAKALSEIQERVVRTIEEIKATLA